MHLRIIVESSKLRERVKHYHLVKILNEMERVILVSLGSSLLVHPIRPRPWVGGNGKDNCNSVHLY